MAVLYVMSAPRIVAIAAVSFLAACSSSQPATSTSAAPTRAPSALMPSAPASSAPLSTAPVEVAVTVDDLPVHGQSFAGIDRAAIAERFIAAFKAHGLPPVYGF